MEMKDESSEPHIIVPTLLSSDSGELHFPNGNSFLWIPQGPMSETI